MADKIDDGGSAFPQTTSESFGGDMSVDVTGGMSIRDAFAADAPVTFEMACFSIGKTTVSLRLHVPEERKAMWEAMSILRFEYADAMILARRGEL